MNAPLPSIDRRTVLKGLAGVLALSATGTILGACASSSSGDTTAAGTAPAGPDTTAASTAAPVDTSAAVADTAASLVFDPSTFTELTTTVTTAAGDREVAYRFYEAVPYVTKPVMADYQSLVVSVPVRVDGKAIDASSAPILFANGVGGYLPASVATASAVGAGGMGGRMGGPPAGGAPSGLGSLLPSGSSGGAPAGALPAGGQAALQQLALAAGYVVVEPGCRGRTLTDGSGTYVGTAPAAIVDLKAAVRYVRANQGRLPGDTSKIVSTGTSAGGALSSLLAASGDRDEYASLLQELGAADASDAIFAAGAWCPITDLEHADMMYEWNWGSNPLGSGQGADPTLSKELAAPFPDYERSLGLTDSNGTAITADNLGEHLTATYLRPAAATFLRALSDSDRASYLTANPFITWADDAATFSWADFLAHVGARKKDAPAFDATDLSSAENNLFGAGTTAARHFTDAGNRRANGSSASLDADIPAKIDLMNPMHFLGQDNTGRARHWWLRVGTNDTDTSLAVVGNLAAKARNLGDDVDAAMYWDAGHGADQDPEAFIAWIGEITRSS